MRTLRELVVLFIDCQATGAGRGTADIIEIGWASSGSMEQLSSFFVRLPRTKKIPKRVQAVTGITEEDIKEGLPPCTVWKMLKKAAAEVARENALDYCPAVIHYAKYEKPLLRGLHQQCHDAAAFPLRMICTHEIVRRLFDWLPRKSMRAVAGYFGCPVGEYRRCSGHVIATACIWQATIGLLKQQCNIETLEDLEKWLKTPVRCPAPQIVYPMSTTARQILPDCPGVYRMLRSNGDLLYVGKASSLKKRVNSYFRKRSRHPVHIMEMLSQAKKLDVTVTGSALEAAILETDQIKLLSPPYNRALRGNDRGIWFLSSDFEKVRSVPGALCQIGPFSSDLHLQHLSAMKRLLCDREDVSEAFLFLLSPGGKCAVDRDSARKGIASFLRDYGKIFSGQSAWAAFEKVGKSLWEKHLGKKARRAVDPGTYVAGEKGGSWTPESFAGLLESNIVHAMHELRRSRLHVWLSESVLVWEESGKIAIAIFERGRLVLSGKVRVDHELRAPPGYCPYRERLGYFDIMMLDRMKVLTAEIRRLVSEGKWLKLCLGPGTVLDRKKLRRIFYWV